VITTDGQLAMGYRVGPCGRSDSDSEQAAQAALRLGSRRAGRRQQHLVVVECGERSSLAM
jgi:hypothetical protein